MILRHSDQFLRSGCQSIFLNLGRNAQRQVSASCRYEAHRTTVQCFYVSTPSADKFHVAPKTEHPARHIFDDK